MKKILKFIKANQYHIVSISLILILFFSLIFFTYYVFPRFIFSVKNFFNSLIFYFLRVTHINDDSSMPENFYNIIYSDSSLRNIFNSGIEFKLIPYSIDVFKYWFNVWALTLINVDYFKSSFSIINWLLKNLNVIILFVVCFILLVYTFNLIYMSPQIPTDRGFTRSYKKMKNFDSKVFYPIRMWFKNYYLFLKEKIFYVKIFVFVLLFFTNIVNSIIELFSGLLVFVSSLSFGSLYQNVYSFLYSIYPLFVIVPTFIWVILILCLFQWIRYKVAYNKLSSFEHKNCDFVNSTGVITLVSGAPGSSKTTLITDMSLSCEKVFRYKLKDIICKYRDYFPHFDWCTFENLIRIKKDLGQFINRYTIKAYVDNLEIKFNSACDNRFIYFYDYKKYGLYHYDHLSPVSLFSSLKTYAEAYFLYISYYPLSVSNYPIRHDYIQKSCQYFPEFVYHFFTNEEDEFRSYSKTSHILDFDTMRLGRRMDIPRYHLDGSVVTITELDKERGNQFDKQGLKKDDFNVNILNDYFNEFDKLGRHPCTIDHYPFFKVIGDLQRLNSLNADLVGIAESLLYVKKDRKRSNVFPLFTFDSILCDFLIGVREKFIGEYRENRNIYGCFYHFVNIGFLPFVRYKEKIMNTFSYSAISLEHSVGSMDEAKAVVDEVTYYLCDKKIFANRFATDCYYNFFANLYSSDKVSQDSSRRYWDVYPDSDELQLQHSMFSQKLFNISNSNKEDVKYDEK